MARYGPKPRPLAERFWEKVDVRGPDDCWLWTAGKHTFGYGPMKVGPEKYDTAHRIAWTLANGPPVPPGISVCHRCDNPPCCNPAHLFLGTQRDNMADMNAKGRGNRVGLIAGQRSRHRTRPGTGPTPEQRDAAVAEYLRGGVTQAVIAARLGVTRTHVAKWVHRSRHQRVP